MRVYTEYDWSDITPIEQDDGAVPLATIAYNEVYAHASGYLRAVMAKDEKSERALAVATEIIQWNPAHYTVWEYRLRIINAVGREVIPKEDWMVQNQPCVCEDGSWINELTLDNTKNYQIWHYRQCLAVENPVYYKGELAVIKLAIEEDSKNYHAWAHYKWLVTGRLYLFPLADQVKYLNSLLDEDVRNNSAWSFKFTLYALDGQYLLDEQNFASEKAFVEAKIALAPQNESPWNYLVGLYDKYRNRDRSELEGLCLEYTEPEVQSTHALELLQSIYQSTQPSKSISILETLEEYIPTRRGYWNYLRQKVEG